MWGKEADTKDSDSLCIESDCVCEDDKGKEVALKDKGGTQFNLRQNLRDLVPNSLAFFLDLLVAGTMVLGDAR